MKFSRVWAMPNSLTFQIKPIREFIDRYVQPGMFSVDPFANKSRICTLTNDLDPAMCCDRCMDALDFLKWIKDDYVDLVLFDPPYSPRQVSEEYKRLGMTVNMATTQSSYWSNMKIEIARILKPGGVCLSFGWNSNGIGLKRGFTLEEILLVPHGGAHNDTICLAERKN